MNSIVQSIESVPDSEAVDELLLRVAQRADQLAQTTEHGRERDLENWLRAERELLARFTPSDLLPAN